MNDRKCDLGALTRRLPKSGGLAERRQSQKLSNWWLQGLIDSDQDLETLEASPDRRDFFL